ncbi:Testis-expressed protein 19.2 [Lemmus lemmus]
MCPPVKVRHAAKGMSCLYAEWIYQLVYGDQMKICFACFKAALLAIRRLLETEGWEEELSGDENLELSGSGAKPEEESKPGEESQQEDESQRKEEAHLEEESQPKEKAQPEELSGKSSAEGPEYLLNFMWDFTSPGILIQGSVGTELEPDEAVPLDQGPEDDKWNQTVPGRLGGFSPCPHECIIPPLSLWDIFNVNPTPEQPVLLELSHVWPVDKLVTYCLRNLKFFLVWYGSGNVCYLLSMPLLWVVKTQVHRWQILLDPESLLLAYLKTAPKEQDLNRWRLSILESSDLGLELVPADCSLRKGGFKMHSYLPWQSDTPEVWSKEPGERLFVNDIQILRDL